jgi:ferric-dicitrate binding protein FerR (iron transport regulator)
MNIDDPNSASSTVGSDALGRLIHNAGRREDPPVQAYEQTLQLATQAWQRKVRRRRYRLAAAIAAGVLTILAVGWRVITPEAMRPQVAQVDRIIGPVEMRSATSGWAIVDENSVGENRPVLSQGASIRTGSLGRAGLLLGDSHSLRLAQDTEVKMLGESRVALIAGKAYVSTTGSTTDRVSQPVEVVTRMGTAIDVGTQFEIQYRDDRYRLRVREGAVLLRREAQRIHGAAGEQLTIGIDGELHRSSVKATGSDWDWVDDLAPSMAVDGRPLTVLLEWVTHETGRAIRYADAATQRRAETTILHGSIDDLAPLQALEIMLATTRLRHRVLDDGSIVIESR